MGVVYISHNLTNGKEYIGYTRDFSYRRESHRQQAEKGSKLVFHRAIRKYGWDCFCWAVVFQSKSVSRLKRVERRTIRERRSFTPGGYNLTRGGDGFSGKHTEETKQKISLHSSSRRPEVRRKLSKSHIGMVFTEIHKKHLSESAKGRVPTAAIQASAEIRWGVPLTEEHKQKLRKASTGKRHSPEALEKMRLARLGFKHTDEARAKIKEARKRQVMNPVLPNTQRKIAESVRLSWVKRRDKQANSIDRD